MASLENMNFNYYLNDLRLETEFLSVSKKSYEKPVCTQNIRKLYFVFPVQILFLKNIRYLHIYDFFFCLSQWGKTIFEFEL